MAFEREHCAACEDLGAKLSEDMASELLAEVPDWAAVDNSIQRTFTFGDYTSAMMFANKITPIAEQQNHHPDLHISWGKVRVELSTHKVGGLSRKDFIVASKINQLWHDEQEAASI